MVPIVGTMPILVGAVIYLDMTNEPGLAAGLFIHSVVVGRTDYYLRPFTVDRQAKLNPAVILLGVLGGACAFGVIGRLIGPIILGAFKASMDLLADDWSLGDEEGSN